MEIYTQLSIEERKRIYLGLKSGEAVPMIAAAVGRDISTIYREKARNKSSGDLGYLPCRAHQMAQGRKAKHGKKLDKKPKLKALVIEKLEQKWSPEMIAGRLKLQGARETVCHEIVYQFVYSDEGKEKELYKYLVKGRNKRGVKMGRKSRSPIIKERVSISERPAIVAPREEFGHYEGDLTFFKGSQSQNVAVLLERKSRFMFMVKNNTKQSTEVMKGAFNKLAPLPPFARKTITFDNGTEFAKHTLLKHAMGMDTFFCDPHSPWQKGQVENANAFMHRYIPKSTHPSLIDSNWLASVQNKLNNLPRKCLGFRTPTEVFEENLL